ncbi:UNVERIFIED_CONTAM: hypothetical protein Sradi_3166700 [Sesamum radiatum]|uniref:Uncharacterized protein n=1 Tax=Sesamum radiatum TaxID=300843 RepID=A0AAW2REA7_SESRA
MEVENDHSISILDHPWLPRPTTFQLIGRPTTLSEDSKVLSLITPDHEWNESLVRSVFCSLDADCFLGISIRGTEERDELI